MIAACHRQIADFITERERLLVLTFRERGLPLPAAMGADTARRTGLRVGARFHEGEEMAEYPMTVVGILGSTNSADDRAIFISLASYWEMNEVSRKMKVKPLTAVLVRPKRMDLFR